MEESLKEEFRKLKEEHVKLVKVLAELNEENRSMRVALEGKLVLAENVIEENRRYEQVLRGIVTSQMNGLGLKYLASRALQK